MEQHEQAAQPPLMSQYHALIPHSFKVMRSTSLFVEMICSGAESEPAQTKFEKDNEQITLENVECKLKDADTEGSVASKSFQFHSLSEKGKSVTNM